MVAQLYLRFLLNNATQFEATVSAHIPPHPPPHPHPPHSHLSPPLLPHIPTPPPRTHILLFLLTLIFIFLFLLPLILLKHEHTSRRIRLFHYLRNNSHRQRGTDETTRPPCECFGRRRPRRPRSHRPRPPGSTLGLCAVKQHWRCAESVPERSGYESRHYR